MLEIASVVPHDVVREGSMSFRQWRVSMSVRGLVFGVGTGLLVSGALHAQQFNGGIPAGWTCTGVCGTSGANGDVPLAPGGGTQYGYVTTTGGVTGVALSGVGGL